VSWHGVEEAGMGRIRVVGLIALIGMVLAACGSGDTTDTVGESPSNDTTAVETTAPAAPPETDAPETTSAAPDSSGGIVDGTGLDWATVDLTTIDWANIDMYTIDFQAVRDNPTAADLSEETTTLISQRIPMGFATLTIGDQVWEFDSFECAFGHENTESAVYAFTSNAFGEHSDGTRVQMQANIRDESGEGRLEGDGLTHEVFINDIEDFDNPVVGWDLNAPMAITIDGIAVSAEGTFTDKTSNGGGDLEGTLVAECSATSRFIR
jgi:hypothetical protein